MKYWDASALLPLIVTQAATESLRAVARDDNAVATWWGSRVECASALARLERESALDASTLAETLARLREVAGQWTEVTANNALREHAIRLLRVHNLRAADAMQLSAALMASDFEPRTLDFVTLDSRQAIAADREGFNVFPPTVLGQAVQANG